MFLTVDKILEDLNSTELKYQYENFKKIFLEPFMRKNEELDKEKIFLSYLLYLMEHEEEKYKYKYIVFYKTFKPLFLNKRKICMKFPFAIYQ